MALLIEPVSALANTSVKLDGNLSPTITNSDDGTAKVVQYELPYVATQLWSTEFDRAYTSLGGITSFSQDAMSGIGTSNPVYLYVTGQMWGLSNSDGYCQPYKFVETSDRYNFRYAFVMPAVETSVDLVGTATIVYGDGSYTTLDVHTLLGASNSRWFYNRIYNIEGDSAPQMIGVWEGTAYSAYAPLSMRPGDSGKWLGFSPAIKVSLNEALRPWWTNQEGLTCVSILFDVRWSITQYIPLDIIGDYLQGADTSGIDSAVGDFDSKKDELQQGTPNISGDFGDFGGVEDGAVVGNVFAWLSFPLPLAMLSTVTAFCAIGYLLYGKRD